MAASREPTLKALYIMSSFGAVTDAIFFATKASESFISNGSSIIEVFIAA
jgi:hypothetical protein